MLPLRVLPVMMRVLLLWMPPAVPGVPLAAVPVMLPLTVEFVSVSVVVMLPTLRMPAPLPAGAEPVPPPAEGTLRSVSGELDLAVGDAARTLASLDLARWHPEVPALLAGLARPQPAPGLPPDTDPLALSLLGRAQRLAAVLDLAMADAPGGAVNHVQAAARDRALRPLADAVRAAVTAAFNTVPR